MPAVHSSTAIVTHGYADGAKAMHWLIAALLLVQFVVSTLMPEIGRNTVPGTLINLHLSFGIVILVVMAIRLIHRLLHPVRLELPESPKWERYAARALHYAFYIILLTGPFLGWASASSHSLPVTVFGILPLPALVAPRTRWANTAGDIHTWMMWTLLGLIALHAAAAFFHHFVRHDDVLRRMLPRGWSRQASVDSARWS